MLIALYCIYIDDVNLIGDYSFQQIQIWPPLLETVFFWSKRWQILLLMDWPEVDMPAFEEKGQQVASEISQKKAYLNKNKSKVETRIFQFPAIILNLANCHYSSKRLKIS